MFYNLGPIGRGGFCSSSVTRLGDFWKFLVTNFGTKVAQIFVKHLYKFEKGTQVKPSVVAFGQLLEKNWATIYSNVWSHCWVTSPFSVTPIIVIRMFDVIRIGKTLTWVSCWIFSPNSRGGGVQLSFEGSIIIFHHWQQQSVWPVKSRQMSIKLPKNDFTRKIKILTPLQKLP